MDSPLLTVARRLGGTPRLTPLRAPVARDSGLPFVNLLLVLPVVVLLASCSGFRGGPGVGSNQWCVARQPVCGGNHAGWRGSPKRSRNIPHRRLTAWPSASKPISGYGSRTTHSTPEHVSASVAASVSLVRQSPSKPPRRKKSSASSSKLKMGNDFSPLPLPSSKIIGWSPSSRTINQNVPGRILPSPSSPSINRLSSPCDQDLAR